MTVRFYEFGRPVGGSSSGGGAQAPAEANYGPGETFDGTVAAADTTINFANSSKHVTIRNTHDTASLQYSLDGGVDWFTIGPYGEIGEFISLTSLILRRIGGVAVTYEVTVIEVE
jgi:hypothetical protein